MFGHTYSCSGSLFSSFGSEVDFDHLNVISKICPRVLVFMFQVQYTGSLVEEIRLYLLAALTRLLAGMLLEFKVYVWLIINF